MLTGYFDESGHEGKGLMVLAGFLGDCDQWKECERAWKIGLGKRKALHTTRLNWSKENRIKKLLDALGPIPHAAGLQAVYSTTAMEDYDDLIVGTEMESLLRSYYLSLLGIIQIIGENIPEMETFKLVMEANDRYEAHAYKILQASRVKKTPDGRPKLVSIEFVSKEATILTQPGDYLAFALLQKHRDPSGVRAKLSSPILMNTRPALGRENQQQKDLVRNLVGGLKEKHPRFLRKVVKHEKY